MAWHHQSVPWQKVTITLAILYFLAFHVHPAIRNFHTTIVQQYPLPDILDPRKHAPVNSYATTLTTNLIIASTVEDNITWTSDLFPHLPNLRILRYISDSSTAEFHPPVYNKGREALMYLTFMRDHHHLTRTPDSQDDGLADVNIFIHAEEFPWHAEPALMKSMLFTLAHLDLQHVVENGYVNLRYTWGGPGEHNCPDGGFNTSTTFEENPLGEEYFMREAFETNFPGEEVPELLAGPCCSQFAVSRETIRGRERGVYERAVDWLVETSWPDQLVGRVWEHMWIWLFKGVARDCGSEEWRTLCAMYKVCFEGSIELRQFEEAWVERERLIEYEFGFWRELVRPARVAWARNVVQVIASKLDALMAEAVDRGGSRILTAIPA
ncbi:uncharacterized protein RCC_09302 [Ramularia collo-cygni]|uniref:Uncharacterized protein n=1 Tax=Ramularia collo-cygni TaxID=112498 RepID=A0A2D3VP17_9PEZI|nr:uncharacterized protein RCC_09302 [Ramularia collo-cygni]CZT23588.1 uncharacterized protein RCC_09302 [Ramularia collo-cygni]